MGEEKGRKEGEWEGGKFERGGLAQWIREHRLSSCVEYTLW